MIQETNRTHIGDALTVLRTFPDESVNCCVTSPPYWGLRDYGVEGQLGLERTPEEYVAKMIEVFGEVRRVLRDDGTLWLNLGDSYASSPNKGGSGPGGKNGYGEGYARSMRRGSGRADGIVKETSPRNRDGSPPCDLASKQLIGIPWRVAFALQADGWYLRSDIIWCLSGGTWLYVRTRNGGICLTTIKDLARLDQTDVELWNGEKWTRLLGMSKSPRDGQEVEIVLRSGERISCTPTHNFPTSRGLLPALDLRPGDTLKRVRLPEPEQPRQCVLDNDAAWFAGLYLAEGCMSGDTIQIAGHAKEEGRWVRVRKVAARFGGSCTRTISGNNMHIRVYGRMLVALVRELVTGHDAHDKGFSPSVWRFSNSFIESMMDGYLGGDGHWDEPNNRWRLAFCRNYNLERDIRTACARLGYRLVLNLARVRYNGRFVPTFRGEIRKNDPTDRNWKRNPNAIREIRWSRCRNVYDLGVADEPHVFALASGILTHNSKPNPMPESVTDRPTKAHEYLFLLAKSERYYFDADAIREPFCTDPKENYPERARITGRGDQGFAEARGNDRGKSGGFPPASHKGSSFSRGKTGENGCGRVSELPREDNPAGRNKRSVWTIPTHPYPEAHFATFPEALVEPCIKAGCPVGGVVLDPFMGSGTVARVAIRLRRQWVGIDLNPKYVEMQERRVRETQLEAFV